MADNILKNEFMWEEKKAKKKLYKNWKLYASALGIIVIGAGTGLGIYYGINGNHSEITKIDLSTLNTSAITGTSLNMTEEEVFNAFKENNKDKDLDFNKFDITITKYPGYDSDNGSFTITAKENTKYTGSTTITINGIVQTNINTLKHNSIDYQDNMNENTVLEAFINQNSEAKLNKTDFTAKITKEANWGTEGETTITAKENTKYTGSTTITINGIVQTNINTLKHNSIDYQDNMNENTVLEAFINQNSEAKLNKTDFTAKITKEANWGTEGETTITAKENTKYTGSTTITINAKTLEAALKDAIDKIRKIHSEGIAKHSEDEWIDAWTNYFNLEKSAVTNITFSLTEYQLSSRPQIIFSLLSQLKTINSEVLEDLTDLYSYTEANASSLTPTVKDSSTITVSGTMIIRLTKLGNNNDFSQIYMSFVDNIVHYTKI